MNKLNCVKKITCFALLLISLYTKAGSCVANGTGNWETPGTWSCGNKPGAGDDVTIGAGIIVTVNATNATDIGNLDIFGTLQFTNGSKINLAATSIVNVYLGGIITGGNGGAKLVFPSASYSGPFSTTGTFYFTNIGSGGGILPLTLVSFYATQQNQDVILYWRTVNEENINSFEIESGNNGSSDWQALNMIPSMAADGGGYSYSFTDLIKKNGDRYYRLKIIDRDGKYVYSKIVFITSNQTGTLSLTPTLVSGSMNVNLPAPGLAQVSIYNTSGQLVKTLINGSEVFSVDVSNLSRGEYFLRASQGKNFYTTKFLKQ
jgi:hypothetical protein